MNEKEVTVLNDDEIVQLYFERSEDGIAQSQQQYGKLCRSVGVGRNAFVFDLFVYDLSLIHI